MIPIARSIGEPVEVAYDLSTDRVVISVGITHLTVWLTEGEAEVLADDLMVAARELRRRRENPD